MRKCCIILTVIIACQLLVINAAMASCIPVVTISQSQNNGCLGAAITFHVAVENEGTNGVYRWKRNNVDAGVNSSAKYTSADFRNGDIVLCEYRCKTTCGVDTTIVSKSITVSVLNDITPAITIANNDPLICEGEVTIFTATAFYGSAIPSYQWSVNGKPVGTNSLVFSTSSITNGAQVECKLTITTPSCPGSSMSTTSKMAIYVYPMIHPTIKITPSKTDICRGEEVTFTATANGGAHPRLSWKINGTTTGPDAPALRTNTLRDGDVVSCTVTIDQDSRCHTSTSAPSNEIVMHVKDYKDPTLKIAATDLNICPGTNVTFTATAENAGNYKSYQWQVNGRNAGNNSAVFLNGDFANGDKVTCILATDVPGCPFPASVVSNDEAVKVKDLPVITFSPAKISVQEGESAQLHATVTGNIASHLWTPEGALITPRLLTSATVPLAQDAVFKLNVTGLNGCTASKELVVKVLHKLHMPSVFTPNKDGKNDVFRIPPGSSLTLTDFSIFDRWGNVVFKTTDITKGWNGMVNGLTVATGTFIYLIRGVFQDKEVVIKGTVVLLR